MLKLACSPFGTCLPPQLGPHFLKAQSNLRQGESHVLGEENTAVRWEEGVFCLV